MLIAVGSDGSDYSIDGGESWSTPEPLRYDDGGKIFSPSSIHRLFRHSNDRLYWIANVCDSNPKGNSPRYPLVIAQLDEDKCAIMRPTLTVIDTRQAGEENTLQLSNFGVYEDRRTKEIVVALPRLFAMASAQQDWTAALTRYRITV